MSTFAFSDFWEEYKMHDKRHHSLPLQNKKEDKLSERIIGNVKGTYETQAINDQSRRDKKTNMAIPSDRCVELNRNWVNENKK